jgi:hypothetical protein
VCLLLFDDSDQDNNDGDDQQYVDESTHGIGGYETEQPQDDHDDGNRIEHSFPFDKTSYCNYFASAAASSLGDLPASLPINPPTNALPTMIAPPPVPTIEPTTAPTVAPTPIPTVVHPAIESVSNQMAAECLDIFISSRGGTYSSMLVRTQHQLMF